MMRRALLLVLLVGTYACAGPVPTPTPSSTPAPSASATITQTSCSRPAPVYHPTRLAIRSMCEVFRGVVIAALEEADGDDHFWISPDPGDGRFLNSMNVYHGQPALVAEIVPACSSEPADSSAAAQCPASQLTEPQVGQHVEVRGPWVTDTIHGWNEIHPVTDEQLLRPSARHLTYPTPDSHDLVQGEA